MLDAEPGISTLPPSSQSVTSINGLVQRCSLQSPNELSPSQNHVIPAIAITDTNGTMIPINDSNFSRYAPMDIFYEASERLPSKSLKPKPKKAKKPPAKLRRSSETPFLPTFKISRMTRYNCSAYLGGLNLMKLTKLAELLKQSASINAHYSHKKCQLHACSMPVDDETKYRFSLEEDNTDLEGNFDSLLMTVKSDDPTSGQLVKFCTVKIFANTRSIQIQGNPERVKYTIQDLFTPLMSLASTCIVVDLLSIKCVDCFLTLTTPAVGDVNCGQLAIADGKPASPEIVQKSVTRIPTARYNTPQTPIVLSASAFPPNSPIKLTNQKVINLTSRNDMLENELVAMKRELNTLKADFATKAADYEVKFQSVFNKLRDVTAQLKKEQGTGGVKHKPIHNLPARPPITTATKSTHTDVVLTKDQATSTEDLTVAEPILSVCQATSTHDLITQQKPDISVPATTNSVASSTRPLFSDTTSPGVTPQRPSSYGDIRSVAQNRVSNSASVAFFGASNTGKISNGLKNCIPGVKVTSTPGATFEHLVGDVSNASRSDVLVICGGVNDAAALDNVELARPSLIELIRLAKTKARHVVIVPPPPIDTGRHCKKYSDLYNIMCSEANRNKVEFVHLSARFNIKKGQRRSLFNSDGLHVTKLGGGLLTLAILDHLSHLHCGLNLIRDFCFECSHTGHNPTTCPEKRSRTTHHHHESSSSPWRTVTPRRPASIKPREQHMPVTYLSKQDFFNGYRDTQESPFGSYQLSYPVSLV